MLTHCSNSMDRNTNIQRQVLKKGCENHKNEILGIILIQHAYTVLKYIFRSNIL